MGEKGFFAKLFGNKDAAPAPEAAPAPAPEAEEPAPAEAPEAPAVETEDFSSEL